MKKEFSEKIYKKYLKLVPELKNTVSVENLWNTISEMYNIEASIKIGKTIGKIDFTLDNNAYTLTRKTNEIQTFTPSGSIKEENYNLLLKDALEYIVLNKLISKKKTKKNNSKMNSLF